mmetsp:Transcript_161339/g.297618  ORF Transcript_161339/g.297618 Transcript_161339/m.297618 type:complete len:230 (-) Transcript_161339:388-1077(-)
MDPPPMDSTNLAASGGALLEEAAGGGALAAYSMARGFSSLEPSSLLFSYETTGIWGGPSSSSSLPTRKADPSFIFRFFSRSSCALRSASAFFRSSSRLDSCSFRACSILSFSSVTLGSAPDESPRPPEVISCAESDCGEAVGRRSFCNFCGALGDGERRRAGLTSEEDADLEREHERDRRPFAGSSSELSARRCVCCMANSLKSLLLEKASRCFSEKTNMESVTIRSIF